MLRGILAFSTVALILGACTTKAPLGSGGGSGGGTSWDPCAGKSCGAQCSLCSPTDPNCVETMQIKVCDVTGKCGSSSPSCGAPPTCSVDGDCPAVGAPCHQCSDGSYACPWSKCENGQCVSGYDTCQNEQCASDDDCPQVGAPCQVCPDGQFACPWNKCENGQCVGGIDGCQGYDPCAGKGCGENCSLCAPDDPNCAEFAVAKYCDPNGQCGLNFPVCSTNQCQSAADCPAIELCKPCADGQCAEVDCLNGQCGWTCPAPKVPECQTAADCLFPAICKDCGNGQCATGACLNGSCQLVCN
jgi:hypothetical protein